MPTAPTAQSPERRRILIVEDDDALRRSLQLLFASLGYEVRAYPDGQGLAADVEALKADCLIADLLLPEGDAMSLLLDLRQAGWSGPAILISGNLTDELASLAREKGYDVVLPKPIGHRVLAGWVDQLLNAAQRDDVAVG